MSFLIVSAGSQALSDFALLFYASLVWRSGLSAEERFSFYMEPSVIGIFSEECSCFQIGQMPSKTFYQKVDGKSFILGVRRRKPQPFYFLLNPLGRGYYERQVKESFAFFDASLPDNAPEKVREWRYQDVLTAAQKSIEDEKRVFFLLDKYTITHGTQEVIKRNEMLFDIFLQKERAQVVVCLYSRTKRVESEREYMNKGKREEKKEDKPDNKKDNSSSGKAGGTEKDSKKGSGGKDREIHLAEGRKTPDREYAKDGEYAKKFCEKHLPEIYRKLLSSRIKHSFINLYLIVEDGPDKKLRPELKSAESGFLPECSFDSFSSIHDILLEG